MATLKQIEDAVDQLSEIAPDIFSFGDAFTLIEEASRTNVDTASLRTILNRFRMKLPNLIAFKRLRADAGDLAVDLTITDLQARLKHIKDRNDLLSELTDELQTQVDKANSDAIRLTRIKEGVENATKTVNELKSLVSSLTATDASTKSRIAALLETLGNISSILHPES
jgi:FtsZ-binding cell division protein ZapB